MGETTMGMAVACYAANREQPQIENSNEMHDIHCAIMVFMAEGHIALAGGNEYNFIRIHLNHYRSSLDRI